MPELPDLAILADAFDAALSGRPVVALSVPDPLVLRATPDRAASLVGQTIRGVGRRGKHLILRLDRDDVWAAPMLSGRFALTAAGMAKPKPAATFACGPRTAPGREPAHWVLGAAWLPLESATVELRYMDPTRMGKLYVVGGGDIASVPGAADLGPDADDPGLTLDAWMSRMRRHPGELKPLLRNQGFVAGIGNAYSDEILWEARLSPFRRRTSLAPEEVAALHAATAATLGRAVEILRERVPPRFEKQVRDHLQVHLRGGEACPRCGATISQVGGREATSYCRACQR